MGITVVSVSRADHTARLSCGHEFTIGLRMELPEVGAAAFCPICSQARTHDWYFYANGTFCTRCGAALGDSRPCR